MTWIVSRAWVCGVVVSAACATAWAGAPAEPETPVQTSATVQPPAPVRDVGDLLTPILAARGVPGVGACLIVGDEVRKLGVAGLREKGGDAPVTVDDLWHVGSCAKAMTATLAAVLVERGVLTWDATPPTVFPELAEAMHESWGRANLRLLLAHRAGAPINATRTRSQQLATSAEPTHAQRRMLVEMVCADATLRPPGTRFEYSNVGYALAGAMCERAGGLPFEALIQREVFAPLGITSAGVGAPGVQGTPSQPRGHTDFGAPVQPGAMGDNPAWMGPAGALHMTLRDWAAFVALHLRGHPENPNRAPRLLKPKTFDTLLTTDVAEYALGWGIAQRPWAGGTVVTHSGSNTMWFCVVWMAPRKDFAVLACVNMGGTPGAQAADDAVGALIRAHLEGQ